MQLSALRSDVRFALRQIARSPLSFGALLATLVVGIGSTTAMFSLLQALLWRPLPYPDPERLVMLWAVRGQDDRLPVSIQDFRDIQQRTRSVEHLSAAHTWLYSLSSPDDVAEGVVGSQVTGSYFDMLGSRPLHGRFLQPEDDRAGAPPVAVIGAAVWRRRFGADPGLVGRDVWLDGRPYTVVGIAPERFGFSFPRNERAQIWTPFSALPARVLDWYLGSRDSREWFLMGRLRAGVRPDEAEAELNGITALPSSGDPGDRLRIRLMDLQQALLDEVPGSIWLRFGAVALAFLAVCSNVSSLLLARAQARRSELSTRAALGATRARLVQQLLTETVALFLLAAPLAALCAWLLVDLFRGSVIRENSQLTLIDVTPDGAALGFCIAAALGSGLLCASVPAFAASRVDLAAGLQRSGAGATLGGTQTRLRGGLVVAQIALAFALLTGSGLALDALARLLRTPMGFDPTGLVLGRLIGEARRYDDTGARRELARAVLQRMAALPGVQSVAADDALLLSGYDGECEFEIEGQPLPEGQRPGTSHNSVSPGFFETLRIPVLRGRGFTDADGPDARSVVIISQTLAERYFPGQDPLGRRLRHPGRDGSKFREIVGVVGDVRRHGLAAPMQPETYTPIAQGSGDTFVFVARSDRPEQTLRDLPAAVAEIDPLIGMRARSLEARVAASVDDSRNLSLLLGSFACVALTLATFGLYALVAYSLSLRTRELGIRSALGAPPAAVIWLVMRSGLRWLGLGSVLGVAGAFLIGNVVARSIPGARGFDLHIYGLVALALGAACALASFVPAARAARIPPASALRQ